MDETYNNEDAGYLDIEPAFDTENTLEEKSANLSRRDFLYLSAGALWVGLGITTTGQESAQASQPNSTVPLPTPTPHEADPYAYSKQIVESTNNQLVPSNKHLILPTIEETEEIDWKTIEESINFWGTNTMEENITVSAPHLLLRSDLNVAFIAAPATGDGTIAPKPLAIYNSHTGETIDWQLYSSDTQNIYYIVKINEIPHELSVQGIAQLEQGIVVPQSTNITDWTPDYKYIGEGYISDSIGQLINLNPELRNSVKIATIDGYISPDFLFDTANSAHRNLSSENTRVISPPPPDVPFSRWLSHHNTFTQSVIRGKGPGHRYKGLIGPEAGLDIVVTDLNPNNDIAKLVNDRLALREASKEVPLTFTVYPFNVSLNRRGLLINDIEYTWNSKEFLSMLKDLNIIVTMSMGNDFRFIDIATAGLDLNDPELVQLYLDTHVAVTQGIIDDTGKLVVDPNKGMPKPGENVLQDATFISPGVFPAYDFATYHILDPEVNVDLFEPLFSKYRHGIIKKEMYVSGSSMSTACIGADLAAFAMAHKILSGTSVPAFELLRIFKNEMLNEEYSSPTDENIKVKMRSVDHHKLLNMIHEAIVMTTPNSNHYLPFISPGS